MPIILALIVCFAAATIEFFGDGVLSVLIPYGLVIPILIMLPRLVMKRMLEKRGVTGNLWLSRTEAFLFVIVFLNALGSLFFHAKGFQYDRFLHFSMGYVCVPLGLIVVLVFFRIAGRYTISKARLLGLVFITIFTGLFAWEGLQFMLDTLFDSKLFHDISQPIVIDFWEDIFFGFAGMLIGLWRANRLYERVEEELRG